MFVFYAKTLMSCFGVIFRFHPKEKEETGQSKAVLQVGFGILLLPWGPGVTDSHMDQPNSRCWPEPRVDQPNSCCPVSSLDQQLP